MNKVKMFFIAAALVLTTAGVFAGKAKFQTIALYASNNGTSGFQLTGVTTLSQLTTTNTGSQATITDRNSVSYGLYQVSGTTYTALYSTVAW